MRVSCKLSQKNDFIEIIVQNKDGEIIGSVNCLLYENIDSFIEDQFENPKEQYSLLRKMRSKDKVCFIYDLFVVDKYRNNDIGSNCMYKIIEIAFKKGFNTFFVNENSTIGDEITSTNDPIMFYKQFGFKKLDKIEPIFLYYKRH